MPAAVCVRAENQRGKTNEAKGQQCWFAQHAVGGQSDTTVEGAGGHRAGRAEERRGEGGVPCTGQKKYSDPRRTANAGASRREGDQSRAKARELAGNESWGGSTGGQSRTRMGGRV